MSRVTPRARKIEASRRELCESCGHWKIVPGETYVEICTLWWRGFDHKFFKDGARCPDYIARGESL